MAAIRYINVGTTANDNTGSTLRGGGQLLNNNFSSLIRALSTDGQTITINTASTPSNTYLQGAFLSQVSAVATYSTNTVTFATFAQNTATIALINDRMQVSNTTLLVNDRYQVANALSDLANTNLAVADRLQVANAAAYVQAANNYAFSAVAVSSTPNYGAAVTYDVSANGTAGYVITNMGFDKIGNNPTLTVRNQTTIAFDLTAVTSSHPFQIQDVVGNYSNTLIHVAEDGTVTSGASAQGKYGGVLYWQIPHDISGTGNAYKYQCSNHAGMNGNVVIKDTRSMS